VQESHARKSRAAPLRMAFLLRRLQLTLEFEEEGAERRERQEEGVGAVLGVDVFGIDAAEITDAGAAIACGVGVENFLVETVFRNADAIVAPDDGRGVENDHQKIFAITGAADERQCAAIGVVTINPFEARPFEIHFVESRLRRV